MPSPLCPPALSGARGLSLPSLQVLLSLPVRLCSSALLLRLCPSALLCALRLCPSALPCLCGPCMGTSPAGPGAPVLGPTPLTAARGSDDPKIFFLSS